MKKMIKIKERELKALSSDSIKNRIVVNEEKKEIVVAEKKEGSIFDDAIDRHARDRYFSLIERLDGDLNNKNNVARYIPIDGDKPLVSDRAKIRDRMNSYLYEMGDGVVLVEKEDGVCSDDGDDHV